GLGGTLGEGRDLSPLWGASPAAWHRPVFLEATQPGLVGAGWNDLGLERGVALDGLLLIRSLETPPRLYRIADGQPPVDAPAATENALLDAWDAAAPPRRTLVPSAA